MSSTNEKKERNTDEMDMASEEVGIGVDRGISDEVVDGGVSEEAEEVMSVPGDVKTVDEDGSEDVEPTEV